MVLTVKAYLQTSGNDCEVRRFSVPSDFRTSYPYYDRKISEMYPKLKGSYRLLWKDPEGDDVTFSSDEELAEAIQFVDNGLLKIKVEVDTSIEKDNKKSKPIQQDLVCVGCGNELQGKWYTCLVCPDYILCDPCEESGLHMKHTMVTGDEGSRNPRTNCNTANKSMPRQSPPVDLGHQVDIGHLIQGVTSCLQTVLEPMQSFSERDNALKEDERACPNDLFQESLRPFNNTEKTPSSHEDDVIDGKPPPSDTTRRNSPQCQKVKEALSTMTKMGFNNHDGWLTSLLEEKDGDISKVLDAIQQFEKE